MSGHEGLLDMLVAVAQVMRQQSTEQLANELTLVHANPPAGHMVSAALRGYLRQAEVEAALATAVRHFEQVPRAWIDAAVATMLNIAKEPYEMRGGNSALPRAADALLNDRVYIPTSAPHWAPVDLERMQRLRRRQAAILAAIEKNDAALLPADLQAKPES